METTYTDRNSSEILVEGGVEGGLPLIAKAKAGGSMRRVDGSETLSRKAPVAGLKSRTIAALRSSSRPLVVDDFHYLDREMQGSIVRALKPLVFEGHAVVFIAIPHRRYDVVGVEKEMTGRILPISVPMWTQEELTQIATSGFPKLDIAISKNVIQSLASEAYGSPHLMQEFCRGIAIDQLSSGKYTISGSAFYDNVLYKTIAEATGKVIFDKLAKGPRQRTDRIPCALAGGGSADIYRVVLLALSHISPGLSVIDYESLRSGIRAVLSANVPQANEITRVLEKMAEIAAKDDSSVAVLDWDKDEQKLHITDPFFAFFLKWSEDYIRAQPIDNAEPSLTF